MGNPMDLWQHLTRRGNHFFERGLFLQADIWYRKALNHSKYLIMHGENRPAAIDYMVIAYLNLGDTAIEKGSPESAGQLLIECHRLLSQLMSQTVADNTAFQSCLRGKTRLAESLATLLQTNPEVNVCQDCYLQVFGLLPQNQPLH